MVNEEKWYKLYKEHLKIQDDQDCAIESTYRGCGEQMRLLELKRVSNEETLTKEQEEIRDAYREQFNKPNATFEEASRSYVGKIEEDRSVDNYVKDWVYEEFGGLGCLGEEELDRYFDWKQFIRDTLDYSLNIGDDKHVFYR